MSGITDKVSIIGMGCTKFGERFDTSREDLVLEAINEALDDAGLELKDIDAFWFGSFYEMHGTSLSSIIKPDYKPVTRIENNCCTGADALRNAAYAVAAGEYKVVMAIGMDKLKDNGFSGNPFNNIYRDNTEPSFGGPASFSLLAPAYAEKYNVSYENLREAMMHVSYKNHYNGSLNPKALYRKEVPLEQIAKSPMICEPYLTVMDCSGVSDGAACAILTSTENAKKYRPDPMYIKAAEIVASAMHIESKGFKPVKYNKIICNTVNPKYKPQRALAVYLILGVRFSSLEPGASAKNICLPATANCGNTAVNKIIIPIPPNH